LPPVGVGPVKNDVKQYRCRVMGVKYLEAEMDELTQVAEDREGETSSQGRPLFGMGSTEGQITKEEEMTTCTPMV
jgi:hypothetical protein